MTRKLISALVDEKVYVKLKEISPKGTIAAAINEGLLLNLERQLQVKQLQATDKN
ncbi:MAG: hypothetical protein KME15_26425 [Drouetiella hepatica Uher 2000/2452]|jgi:hypothetical protein|uniref:Uncharacterized protein n=1 Tax=Drouetiella hepatica Uher 2000/2452 TaxID=904376 RepID=A0A951QGH4_9CYAN|nr:hypothetical protein [Drouetiella hepatica Uher 2000/2452]